MQCFQSIIQLEIDRVLHLSSLEVPQYINSAFACFFGCLTSLNSGICYAVVFFFLLSSFVIRLFAIQLFEQMEIRNDDTIFMDAVLFIGSYSRPSRAVSVPPAISSPPLRSLSVQPRDIRATSVPRFDPLSPLDLLSEYEREPFQRALSPTPIKCGRWAPRSSEIAFDSDGNFCDFCDTVIRFFGIV